jgi:DNA-binding MarR family transcriptional regulator
LNALGQLATARQTASRSVHVTLIQEGHMLIDRVLPGHLADEERLLSPLSAAQRRALADNLRKLPESLGDSH